MSDAALPAEFLEQISDFTLKVCRPLYWHDRRVPFPKEMRGGSCFVLRFADRLVGVTAAHVIDIYRDDRKQNPHLISQLRTAEFALNDAIIDHDPKLDIATLAMTQSLLEDIGAIAIDCTGHWPPPEPAKMRAMSVCGFPETQRVTFPDKTGAFQAYGGLPAIEDFSERDILLTFDTNREQPLHGLPLPPLGMNLSGCSGGPGLMHALGTVFTAGFQSA